MHNMKFKIESQEHREQIRNELKRIGFDVSYWHPYDFVCVYSNGDVVFTNNPDAFNGSYHTETTLKQLKQMK